MFQGAQHRAPSIHPIAGAGIGERQLIECFGLINRIECHNRPAFPNRTLPIAKFRRQRGQPPVSSHLVRVHVERTIQGVGRTILVTQSLQQAGELYERVIVSRVDCRERAQLIRGLPHRTYLHVNLRESPVWAPGTSVLREEGFRPP